MNKAATQRVRHLAPVLLSVVIPFFALEGGEEIFCLKHQIIYRQETGMRNGECEQEWEKEAEEEAGAIVSRPRNLSDGKRGERRAAREQNLHTWIERIHRSHPLFRRLSLLIYVSGSQ